MQPTGKGRDRISIVEDTDGDGKADKVSLFAENLSIPTSLCYVNGGLIVAQAPDMLFLSDTDGDGKADERRSSSPASARTTPTPARRTSDTGRITGSMRPSATPASAARSAASSTFRQGLPVQDGRLGAGGPPQHEQQLVGRRHQRGRPRLRLDRQRMPSVYMPIPNRYYESVRGMAPPVLQNMADSNRFFPITENVRQVDWYGGFTAGAGSALYTAHLPEALLEQDGLHRRADRAPRRDIHAPAGRHRLSLARRLEPGGERRRVDVADPGRVGPDGQVWVMTGTTSSCSTIRRPKAKDRQGLSV